MFRLSSTIPRSGVKVLDTELICSLHRGVRLLVAWVSEPSWAGAAATLSSGDSAESILKTNRVYGRVSERVGVWACGRVGVWARAS